MKSLSEETTNVAFNRLFPDCGYDYQARKKFANYVNKQYDELKCAVLWARSDSFSHFLCMNNLDSERREVIITENKHVLFSEDWKVEPKLLHF